MSWLQWAFRAGSLAGQTASGKLVKMFGKDLPAALTEDAVAILIAVVAVRRF